MLLKCFWVHCLCLIVMGLCTSCVAPPEGLPTVERVEQEDVPVPADFELRSSYSPDWKLSPGVERARSWTGTYTGMTQVGEVAPWYVTEMQKHNWRFSRLEERDDHNKLLYFQKGGESSSIHIQREISSKVGGYITVIKARISPRGPEEFTVDENLRWRDGDAAIQPVRFREEAPVAPSDAGPVGDSDPPPRTVDKRKGPASDPVKEIQELESSAAH